MTLVIPMLVIKVSGILFLLMIMFGLLSNLPDNPKSSVGATIGAIGFICFLAWLFYFLGKGLLS